VGRKASRSVFSTLSVELSLRLIWSSVPEVVKLSDSRRLALSPRRNWLKEAVAGSVTNFFRSM
jgi:hypothetical protein